MSPGQVVVEQSHMSGEVFNLYLHQNYLDFFSEVDDVAQASKYLSDADLLTACWMVSLLWLSRFLTNQAKNALNLDLEK